MVKEFLNKYLQFEILQRSQALFRLRSRRWTVAIAVNIHVEHCLVQIPLVVDRDLRRVTAITGDFR